MRVQLNEESSTGSRPVSLQVSSHSSLAKSNSTVERIEGISERFCVDCRGRVSRKMRVILFGEYREHEH